MSSSISSISPPSARSEQDADSPSATASSPSFFENLFNSIFSPELNSVPQRIMNFSFYGLFLVLFALVFLSDYNPHVIALLTLSLGLFLSVNWFLKELSKMPASSKEIQQMPTAHEATNESEDTKKDQ